MSLNPAYLIECALYEKCLKQSDNGDYLSEFQRIFPHLFNSPFRVTPEIEDLDTHREKLIREIDEIPEDDEERYNDIEDAIWFTYRYEVNTFYEANKPKLDAIISHYKQFLNGDGEKEELVLKIVRTPAGHWLATKHQSWLLARNPFTLKYTCKALGIYFYRWLKRVLKGWRLSLLRREFRKLIFEG